jgi:hypothetical protein
MHRVPDAVNVCICRLCVAVSGDHFVVSSKSNAAYKAFGAAMRVAKEGGSLMRELG